MSRFLLPFLFVFSLIACCIEIDISVPSFPGIAQYFQVSESLVQMTIAVNFLGLFIASMLYGPLSESYGRRKMMVIGNGIMLIGALGCAAASSIWFLLGARLIQGLGAGASTVIVFVMIADVYKGHAAVRLIGLMNALLTVFMACAPIMGGFINKAIGWRASYLFVAVVSLVSWFLLLVLLPETKKKCEKFCHLRMIKDYKRLLANRTFLVAALIPSLLYGAYLAFITCASFLYMETFSLPIMTYTLHQSLIIASFSLTSIFASNLVQKIGNRRALISACIVGWVGITGLVIVSLSRLEPIAYLTTLFMVVLVSGCAVVYPVVFADSMEIFPNVKGIASSVIMSIRAFLCFVVIGISSYFYNGFLWPISLIMLIIVLIVGAGIFYLLPKREAFYARGR